MGSEENSAAWALLGRMEAGVPLMVTAGMPELSIATPRMVSAELVISRVCPELATDGSTRTIVGGAAGGGWVTLTRAVARVVPPGPVAVSVYVVESSGDIDVEPAAATRPPPGSRSRLAAFMEVQTSVTEWPFSTLPGSARRLISGAGGAGGLTSART